ncbi:MAG: tetratricopeptide repeat protein [Kofleriaceae bacterium]
MERRLAVHARTAVIAAVSLLASTASAAPNGPEARAAFDKGVAAYKKADYAGAADALGRSFTLEADADTLYAWAQTERKLNHCDKAVDLYERLLTMELPEANKAAVVQQIDECKVIIAAQKPVATAALATPEPTSSPPGTVSPAPERPETPSPAPAWLNPVGLGLVALGAVGLGAGGVFLAQASAADSDKDSAMTYGDFERFDERATSRGRLGVIAAASGAVLLTAGIVYIVTRKPVERQSVTVIVEPTGVGLAGRF